MERSLMALIFKDSEHIYVCELWYASSKHPDSVHYFDAFKKCELMDTDTQVFQWLLEIAARLTWPMHARALAQQALDEWYPAADWVPPEVPEWSRDHWHPRFRF